MKDITLINFMEYMTDKFQNGDLMFFRDKWEKVEGFTSSWDNIMPVIEAIYDEGSEDCGNLIGDITHALVDIDIVAVTEAIINYIQWKEGTLKSI